MSIDVWADAPEGATHYDPVDQNFLREVGPALLMYRKYVGWVVPHHYQYAHTVEDTVRPLMIRPEWNGEGLPPVGTVCEVTTNDGHNWHPWKVLFADEYVILVGSAEGKANYKLLRRCDADVAFRLIRTAEQIATDELREKYMPTLIELWNEDTNRSDFIEAVLKLIREASADCASKQVAP